MPQTVIAAASAAIHELKQVGRWLLDVDRAGGLRNNLVALRSLPGPRTWASKASCTCMAVGAEAREAARRLRAGYSPSLESPTASPSQCAITAQRADSSRLCCS